MDNINIENLLKKNENEIKKIKCFLERKGWCPISFPHKFIEIIDEFIPKIEMFFQKIKLTGDFISTMVILSELSDNDILLKFIYYIDKIAKGIIYICGEEIFDVNITKLAKTNNIPLLLNNKDYSSYSILDIVEYYNNDYDIKNNNVSSHRDPGLKLYDPEINEWITPPNNMGILWCGSTAVEITNS